MDLKKQKTDFIKISQKFIFSQSLAITFSTKKSQNIKHKKKNAN